MDLNKTLEQLENDFWNDSTYNSHLVKTCHELRKKPLKDFNIEDLRILIGQQLGLIYLVPLAINQLEKNILAEGDYYPGDLLFSVLQVDPNYWSNHETERERLLKIVKDYGKTIGTSKLGESATKDILKALDKFLKT